jgi:hypothetical protein
VKPAGVSSVPSKNVTAPMVSTLNLRRGQIVPNATIAGLGVDGRVDVYNRSRSTDLLVDVAGYFTKN